MTVEKEKVPKIDFFRDAVITRKQIQMSAYQWHLI